ncbi:P-loop containing nucleoside triphosphate hydrolase protein [Desarmillaria tabescens]|uniref:P-loop containing nucleoside triphosphate hydrolase protein n=1 Tax=Armillaria tabescens TaxID=1929756 RepID=A0AA39TWA5_ARMTA|nr:P-loop containing nucleoside triphosphate hydrolase protein [Desarmillaria tabescens]KAK0465179.1 P-loop containing nucleoside triphosphate hydrolase protein [Desarmillaria tabescens]
MAKKKKTQVKPVARGFATTSVPKKVEKVVESEEVVDSLPATELPPEQPEAQEVVKKGGSEKVPVDEFDPEKVEEQSLQNLVDRLQEKTEKDIVRTVKAVEQERRYSKTLPSLELNPVLVERILDLALDSTSSEGKRQIDEPEDKVVAKLAITYGVLRRLGFSEERVIECLEAIPGFELEQAYDWLYLHCSEDELAEKRSDNSVEPRGPQTPKKGKSSRTPQTPRTPRTPAEFQATPPTIAPPTKSSKLDVNAPIFVPSSGARASVGNENRDSDNAHRLSLIDGQDDDDDDANAEYVRLRLRLDTLNPRSQDAVEISKIKCRLNALKSNYFFDEMTAVVEYHIERDKVAVNTLDARLRGEISSPLQAEKKSPPSIQTPVAVASDVFDEDDGDTDGGILGLLEEIPATETTTQGTIVTVRAMPLPKHWSGRTPKSLLSDTVAKADRYAVITFSIISGASRAKRAAVNIRWRGKKTDEWSMESVACHDEGQAEQYVATLALHAIAFPPADGFASGTSAVAGQTFFRLLPAVFRDLWDELEMARKAEEDSINRRIWNKLRTIVEPKLQVPSKVQRNTLPIAGYREDILAALDRSQVLVLSGETGWELGDLPGAVGTLNSLVGYSIRLESNTTRNTRLAFVTNGIALRMLEGGTGQGGQGTAFDELTVHERTIESDFLLIVLKSLLQQRSDLRVILMSATVDAVKISEFFGGCPTLHVPGRTYPVEVNYLEDAVEFTKWSISENSPYARRLHDTFYRGKNRVDWSEDLAGVDDDDSDDVHENVKLGKKYSPSTVNTINLLDERLIPYDLILCLLERICFHDAAYMSYSSAILVFMPGIGEIRRLNDLLTEHPYFGSDDFRIYPLHSTLSSENQGAVFDIPPSGVRKIVIATNIAETGITIPDITFDEKRQISRLVETFIARSNASQRRGRAGRVQSGLCFHLFTKVRHDTQMVDHPLPEMMRLSLSDLALRIKIMKVNLGTSIEDVLSRALDPPASINVQRAISMLVEVRALTTSEEITPMGRLLSKLPTDVHLGKFLLLATLLRCLDPALTIAAALNSKSPFITPMGLEQEADRAKATFKVDNSDFLTIHNAFSSWRRACGSPGGARKFCRVNFLSHQNLQQIEELRNQFLGYLIDSSFIQVDRSFVRELSRARYVRNRMRFITVPPELDSNSNNTALFNAALVAGLYPKILAVDPTTNEMRTISNNQLAAFHPSSVNFGRKPGDLGANHLAYFTLMHSKKLYAWETTPVDDLAILLLCGESEAKLISDTFSIDRKIKFRVAPKTNIALKHLRTQLAAVLSQQLRGKVLNESQILWNEMALSVLGKVKVEDENEVSISIVV